MYLLIPYIRKLEELFLQFTKNEHLDDIKNLGVPISSTRKIAANVIVIVTEVTKLNFQAT
jgi:hypothetical protein